MKYPRPREDRHGILRIENRIQMFCYYNTLAWTMLAAIIAAAVIFATLPLIVSNELGKDPRFFVFTEAVALVLLAAGVYGVGQLRTYAARWICLPEDEESTSPASVD